MIEEILKTIDQKKEAEIKKIESEKKTRISALKERASQVVIERKKKSLSLLEKENRSAIEEFSQEKNREIEFRLQEEKNIIINTVWEKVIEKIVNLEDKDFLSFINYLVNKVSKKIEGNISAGPRTYPIIKNHFKNSKVRNDLDQEGFLFKSKDLDLDFRIDEIIGSMKEKYNPEIIKILF